ncbi:hypothetical protein GEV33_006201 [Tenebrio molitor]|uniref:Gustatory receptor n=1 Tax=Tenebrio molitor TaxID=7067 RepID=A0A8J6LDE2_TENMO|nr:hypothetical protein GEV33_006201 [Tenebrio molitor]
MVTPRATNAFITPLIHSICGLSQVYQLEVVYLIRMANSTERYVTFSDVSVVLFPSFFGVLMTTFKIDNYIDYYNQLRKIDTLLQKNPPKSKKYRVVLVTTVFFTAVILIFDFVLWVQLTCPYGGILSIVASYLPYYTCYCFTVVMELVYWQFVHTIKTKIMLLNNTLREAIEDCSVDNFMRIDRKKINNVVDTLKIHDLKKQNKPIKKTPNLQQIGDLICAYETLSEAANSVNDCYGLVILIVILGCLIHLLVTPYALYGLVLNTGDRMFIVSQSIWMFGHVLRLLLIVEPCHGCLIEQANTSALICRLMCMEMDKQVKKSLKFFFLCLSQRKIEFTAFGLTKINRELLTGIAGAVTTYLVILFQFN